MAPIRIAVTGACGQIAYSLLFRLAAGELFPRQPIALHLLDLPEMKQQLEGVKMELVDGAFPLLQEIKVGTDPKVMFEGVNWAFLIGAKPRSVGMERKELLADNGKIFQEQGRALSSSAAPDVRVVVVGNPCNTNCLIAIHNSKNIAPERFSAMTRLDANRASALLAERAGVPVTAISHMIIWGNHSTTMVPDFVNARIDAKPACEVIQDQKWLEELFVKKVQNRGAEVLALRGKSSAASAASALIDSVKALITPTTGDTLFSQAVYSNHNSYNLDTDLVFSLPCRFRAYGEWEEVQGVFPSWNRFLEEKIRLSEKELIEERDQIRHLL